ncbi:hypothetical protein OU792_02135 [Algoriphagus sp. NF]|uniref:DUF5683 domain-containing protein n=1 Tax=Algoriphagus marincola TaxID=264027 RepID=A0ABS7N6X1_9BACT|nr:MULTISPECIES: hypothetical protein [Algoriphagus]MBY5952074.1 hypothetical protein [Algoriphagus marincola]MDE0558763.1 hypothetical protein [Algoriphagus sp. NF]
MKKRFWITLLLLFPISFASISLAQNTQESRTYFPGNYSTQPIITFKEGFLNQTTYYLDGQKSNPAEVAALLNSVQSEEFRFSAYQRKKNWGTAINLTGLAVSIGSVAYLFTNEITPANVRPWFWVTFGGGVVQGTGSILIRDADRRIRRSINDFNAYHYSGGADAFLSMDIMDGFLGPKINVYEGPMQLERDQVLTRFQSNPEALQLYEEVLRREKVSTVANVVNSALGIGIFFLAVGFESQSSSQNDLLIPLTFTGVGLNIFSRFYERKTRNLTREALYKYNYQ